MHQTTRTAGTSSTLQSLPLASESESDGCLDMADWSFIYLSVIPLSVLYMINPRVHYNVFLLTLRDDVVNISS